MSRSRAAATGGVGRKSPLRVAGDPVPVIGPPGLAVAGAVPRPRAAYTPREMRQMMISEFGDWLRTQTSRQHSQGGTNTKQRNLRHLFTWLASAHDHPHFRAPGEYGRHLSSLPACGTGNA